MTNGSAMIVPTASNVSSFAAYALRIVDLTTFTAREDILLKDFTLGDGAARFVSPQHVLLSDGRLVDIERGHAVWQYQLTEKPAAVGAGTPFSELFFFVRKEEGSPYTLVAHALPHADVKNAQVENFNPVLLKPGDKVKLSVEVIGDEAYARGQRAEWEKQLAAMGIEVDDKTALTLAARTFLVRGRPRTYTYAGVRDSKRESDAVQFTPTAVGYQVTLSNNSADVWTTGEKPNPDQGPPEEFDVRVNAGESVRQAFARAYPENGPAQASVIKMPPPLITREVKLRTTEISGRSLLLAR